jgi:hypothetical protein
LIVISVKKKKLDSSDEMKVATNKGQTVSSTSSALELGQQWPALHHLLYNVQAAH